MTNEKGPTHAREFEMTCTVGTVETVGRGKTKKIAKKEAASKMMRYFVDMPEDIHPHEWVMKQFNELKKQHFGLNVE